MTDPDLTPEAAEVKRLKADRDRWKSLAKVAATKLEAEKEHGHKFMWHARYTYSRAEAAEARLREAVEALQFCARGDVTVIEKGNRARAFLANLGGDKT